jgi:hypothetical protein
MAAGKKALVLVHVSSLDSYRETIHELCGDKYAAKEAARALTESLVEAAIRHKGPVVVIDNGWDGHFVDDFRAAVRQKRPDAIWVAHGEDARSWESLFRELDLILAVTHATRAIVGGVWWFADGSAGCVNAVLGHLKKKLGDANAEEGPTEILGSEDDADDLDARPLDDNPPHNQRVPRPVVLYTGTTVDRLPKILEKGLTAGEGWGGAGTSGHVFLTNSPRSALDWAKIRFLRDIEARNIEPGWFDRILGQEGLDAVVVLKVEIPLEAEGLLRADMEQAEDFQFEGEPEDWEEAWFAMGELMFEGTIPPMWIEVPEDLNTSRKLRVRIERMSELKRNALARER